MIADIEQSFSDFELAAWTEKAKGYERWYAPITANAIVPLFGIIGSRLSNRRFLDICTGTGHVAGAASLRGADAVGIDFADAMIAIARDNYPAARFEKADAQALPFPDASFDAAVICFGLMHLPDADQALREAFRVLRIGGRFACAHWVPPAEGYDLGRIVDEAVREHGRMDLDLPPAPPGHRFGDAAEATAALAAAGFEDITCDRKTIFWRPKHADDVLDLIREAAVRAPMLLDRQSPAAKSRIEEAIVERVNSCHSNGRIELRFPYLLVGAEKLRSSGG